jgi:hypothetical protein
MTPMLGEEPIELGLKGHEQEFLNTLRRDPLYLHLSPQAFPDAQECHEGNCRVRTHDYLHEVAL